MLKYIYIAFLFALFFSNCTTELDASTAVTSVGKMAVIFEFIIAIIPLLGGLACIVSGIYFVYAGLTGDIQLIVEGTTISMKLINASPGIVLIALGAFLLWKKSYKVKIKN